MVRGAGSLREEAVVIPRLIVDDQLRGIGVLDQELAVIESLLDDFVDDGLHLVAPGEQREPFRILCSELA